MSRQLIESIISNNMLEANDMVEAKMAEIRERKMYEMKRMYAASKIDEMGPFNYKERFKELKAKNAPRASDVWGDEAKAKAGAKDAETPQRRKRPPGGPVKKKSGSGVIGKFVKRATEKMDQYAAEHPPGSAVVNTAKRLATNLSSGQIGQDVKSIAFRNL